MEKIPVTFLHGNVSYLGKDSRIVWITHTRNRMELVPESIGFESWTQLVLVRSRISDDFYNSIQLPLKFLRPDFIKPLNSPKHIRPLVPSSDTIVENARVFFTPTGRTGRLATFPTLQNRADSLTADQTYFLARSVSGSTLPEARRCMPDQ